jgi:hypothetical protein
MEVERQVNLLVVGYVVTNTIHIGTYLGKQKLKEEIETGWRAAAAAEFNTGNHGGGEDDSEWTSPPHLKGDRAASTIVSCSSFNYLLEDVTTYLG